MTLLRKGRSNSYKWQRVDSNQRLLVVSLHYQIMTVACIQPVEQIVSRRG